MFDIGFGEMILLAAIALIAIGPKQLPEVARAVGKLLGEFKRTVGEVTSTVASAREETDRAIRKVTDDLTSVTNDIHHAIQNPTQQPNATPIQSVSPAPPAPVASVQAVPKIVYESQPPIPDLLPHAGDPYVAPADATPTDATPTPTSKPGRENT